MRLLLFLTTEADKKLIKYKHRSHKMWWENVTASDDTSRYIQEKDLTIFTKNVSLII